jgi:hypothetical protein
LHPLASVPGMALLCRASFRESVHISAQERNPQQRRALPVTPTIYCRLDNIGFVPQIRGPVGNCANSVASRRNQSRKIAKSIRSLSPASHWRTLRAARGFVFSRPRYPKGTAPPNKKKNRKKGDICHRDRTQPGSFFPSYPCRPKRKFPKNRSNCHSAHVSQGLRLSKSRKTSRTVTLFALRPPTKQPRQGLRCLRCLGRLHSTKARYILIAIRGHIYKV